uniref:AB hydrolase-1 domain-containing protein n=1 Tax=Leptocylindrus danicus TaxID=163516 RepID=A0A7S2LSW8_9STRA
MSPAASGCCCVGANLTYMKTTHIKANGIHHKLAYAGAQFNDQANTKNPLILFLHGWPDFHFSFRHQLMKCAQHNYFAVAPDMRGYGGTSAPTTTKEYNVYTLCNDVLGIMHALDYEQCFLVGHDWGAWLAWHMCLIYPDAVVAVCALSVPYVIHRPKGLLTHLKQEYGNCISGTLQEKQGSRFNYMLHHNLPHAAEEYDKNVREALYRIYGYIKGVTECDDPEVDTDEMFLLDKKRGKFDGDLTARNAPGLWKRLPRPKALPAWIPESDFERYVSEFEKTGFSGGLHWYQTPDLNWGLTRHLNDTKITQPVLFIGGDLDVVIKTHGGAKSVETHLVTSCPRLHKCVMLKGCGHWVHQEQPDVVTGHLLNFLQSVERKKTFKEHIKSRL